MATTNLFYEGLSRALSQEKQAQAHDDAVERRIEALLAVGGKYDLREQTNIEEAICEARPEFWQKIADQSGDYGGIGASVCKQVRDYFTKKAKGEVEDEIDDERMRAQNPELVNRDE